jgi:GMP synthase (glutamine-hydrolysing)
MPILVVDNMSPFTTDIVGCLQKLNIKYVYRKFSELCDTDLATCDKAILSGRRKNSRQINAVNSAIIKNCLQSRKPLLGICYGAEIIALTLGGSIRKMPCRVQGSIEIYLSKSNLLTDSKKSISAYESHGFCVARLPRDFETLASSKYCEHEIFSSVENKIYATQFHPEKSGSDGLALFQNFAKI